MILDWTSYSWESDMMSNPLPWIFGAQDEVTKQRSGVDPWWIEEGGTLGGKKIQGLLSFLYLLFFL